MKDWDEANGIPDSIWNPYVDPSGIECYGNPVGCKEFRVIACDKEHDYTMHLDDRTAYSHWYEVVSQVFAKETTQIFAVKRG